MKDEQMDELLRGLPRQRASDDLARRIITRLNQPQRRPSPVRRLAFGLVLAAALLVAALSAVLWLNERHRKAEIREEIAALRSEYTLLQARLAELKQRPVVYLGGDERVDYVLDMRKYLHAQVEEKPSSGIPLRHTGGSL